MARRIKIYPLIRQIHLYSALMVMTFLLMYFLTGFVMTKHNWFEREGASVTQEEVALTMPETVALEGMPAYFQETFSIPGRPRPPRALENGQVVLEFRRPGLFTKVEVDASQKKATIERHQGNWVEVVHGLHRVHHYGEGLWFNLFVFFMDLASAGLLIFAVSGVYLWLGLLRNKLWGWACLGIATTYTLWVTMSFMFG